MQHDDATIKMAFLTAIIFLLAISAIIVVVWWLFGQNTTKDDNPLRQDIPVYQHADPSQPYYELSEEEEWCIVNPGKCKG